MRLLVADEPEVAGGTADDFIEPLGKVDAMIGKSDAELVGEDLKLKGFKDDAKREAKINRLTEDGELEIHAEQVRDALRTYRNTLKEEIINDRLVKQQVYEDRLRQSFVEEAKEIKRVLENEKEFLGTPLKPENIDKIVKKYEAGGYNDDLRDAHKIGSFLLYTEYGKRGQENLRLQLSRELKKQFLSDRHNVPPKNEKVGNLANQSNLNKNGKEKDLADLLEEEK